MIMGRIIGLILALLLLIIPSTVEARSGCCSHHGGVCGCGCCDGTGLSSTCAPYYPQCGGSRSYYEVPVYIPPTPENPITEGTVNVIQSATKPYFNVSMSWKSTYPVSIAISRVAGANPGPNTDSTNGFYQFNTVKSGRWYINMKANVNGVWSKIVYWTIDVPVWVDYSPIFTPEPTLTPIETSSPIIHAKDLNDSSTLNRLWKWFSSKFSY
ncbi:hypothetical protein COV53_03180 [Candidatus Gottesmanbacteria bacterium CG11_big_fil_rev_8_21_14_0_20_37_11]|uniref:Uncharacterized protein n=3 Tax=Candidatus Gottesmaniibacteriota TaxID=1752720 RepID=A0A2M7RQM0_9BACT|nr:MAG: hypothetical protein AUJ73_04915 [Candidatus Gottesmanbacteria bacterium CG1_02_37_22]PIP33054.1 MAG: hypothetical protein COX23_01385 [Candidatus Gottesmanbacteria bacterium CG23_combo_of_CG06-09_8_20_14_all_37_19]PIR08402.1 MAG: hypothetical protein COV53_03180 [Candidatus Gottesmanbacteria bacterium CG11_big_fil_rev_8_21_14_0_20_37_11]PIZ02254.1 MAG: hypothetical protein COY59_05735 [Candidatus Gottesmanbacteria bacterium CG_4_10_14_0_8_um_filter_37_24]